MQINVSNVNIEFGSVQWSNKLINKMSFDNNIE